jgi:hypothetical protein
VDNNNLRNPGVPYANGGVPEQPVAQVPTPLFADVARSAPPAPAQPVAPSLTATPVTTAPQAPQPAPLPPATPPTPLPQAIVPQPPTPKKPRDWRRIVLTITFSALFLLFIGAGWLIFEAVRNSDNETGQVNNQIASTSIPLSEFASSGSLNLLGTQSLAVNGQLRANESFVLAPQAQPGKTERGQLYFDSSTNQLAYYNGSQFIQIPGEEEDTATVLTLQGQSGNITLVGGNGLQVDGTTLTNTGITSLGGATGDITLGAGITIVGGALTNTGLVGASGGTGISVVNDGAGNITISNTGAGTGTVTSPNGTPGRIAKFTGVQTIEDSLLSEAGSTVTVNGNLNVTGTTTLANPLGVNSGGTGATSFTANGVIVGNGSGALTAVAAAGVGECLMSTAGAPAFQACPGGGGGVTALNSLTGALTIANTSTAGSTITINDASTSQKGIAQFNSTNFSAAGGVVNTIQNINIAATPTFGALTLTSSQATSPMLLVNNTNGAGTGNLIDLQVNGATRMSVSPSGAMTVTGAINGQTISNLANFTGSLSVAGAANLNGGASVTGGSLTANTITASGAMTVGATGQSLTLQGNASTTLNAVSGANTSTLSFQTPTANVNYRLLTATAGTYDICTSAGNCVGVGGGVTTPGGTTNRLPKFTGAQTLGDSIISDNGTTVSIGGVLAVNTITPTGALTIGATSQALTLQGTATSISSTDGGVTNTLSFATPTGGNKNIVVPNASGTVVVSASGPLAVDAAGNITCATCSTGASVTSLNGLSGALSLAYATAAGSTVTIQDASTAQKGVAQFNSSNFSVTSGNVNTIQDIGVAAAPTFGRLTVTSSQASNAMLLINNTNAGATGNLLDVQLNGSSRLAVTPAGAMTLTGTLNGQTISSAANFTGTFTVASTTTINGAANLNGGATVTGTLTANTITPTGALTVGATNQSFLMQGNASSTITATSGANTTSLAFQTPTASVTYRLLTAAAGTYDICTTVGNCAGVGGGVTTPGGTTNSLAKFTGSNAIGDSIITDNGTTVTIGGTLSVNTITPSGAMTIGATGQNLTLQGATTTLSSTNSGTTNSLTFATPAGGNKTITLPNANGTVAVSASGPLSIDSAGNITCATCVTSGGGGGGVGAVDSLNGLTGTITIANATTGGSTITIDDASTSQKGIAQFNSTNFSAASGVINTIQDISVAAAPTFGRLTVTSSQAGNAMFLINNTNAGASGNLLDVQLNGASRLAVSPAGALTVAGTVNGQTVSSAANFTGTLTVASTTSINGAANLNGGATVTGTLTANTITPTSSLTVGATNQSFLMQGNASSTITATNGANTTTVAFQSPTAAVTYRFLTAAAGTYDVCTTVGNCAGVGGGVTTPGGTVGTLAKFTASGAIGDSIISESGSTVTVSGTLVASTALQTALLDTASAGTLTLGGTNATAISLNENTTVTGTLDVTSGALSLGTTSQAGTVVISDGSSNTASLQVASLSSNRTIAYGDESGTVCLQNSTSCGFALSSGSGNYIQNQNSSDQTANFRISGTGRANTSITTPLVDSISGVLNIGTTNATGINLNKSTTITGNLNQSTGTFSLASNGNGSITTGGLLTVTAATSSTWSVTTGTLTLQAGTGNGLTINGSTNNLNLNTGSSGTITVGSSTTTTVNVGAQTDDARTINIGYPSATTTAQTVNIGANSSTGAITVRSGSGNITLNSGSGTIGLQGATTVTGNLTTTGDVAVNGGDITSSATTLAISATSYVNFDSNVGFIFKQNGNNRAYINGQNGRLEVYAANSFGGMTINGSSGTSVFTVSGDSTEVTIGYSNNAATLLVLDTKTDAGDPTAFNGSMYYNSNAGKFRCYEGGAWKDCITAGAGSVTLQAAYDGGNTVTTTDNKNISFALADTTTDSSFLIDLQCDTSCSSNGRFAIQDDGVDVFTISPAGGALLYQPTVNSTSAFNVKNAAGSNLFTIDSTNSRVGINLGSNWTPSMSGTGLEVNGGISITGSQSFQYTTPGGAVINTRLGISPSDPGAYSQLFALGLNASAQTTARGISLFDARTGTHQPTLAVFSPDENGAIGFTWNGSNTTATMQTLDENSSSDGIIIKSGNVALNGGSGAIQINSGDLTGGDGGTGSIYIVSGSGGTGNVTTGNVVLDSGVKSGSGTNGTIQLGASNASAILIGRTNLTANIVGGLAIAQSFAVNDNVTLGADASDSITLNGVIQGGTPFVFEGATADANELSLAIASLTGDRTVTLGDESGTVCLQSSTNCGFALSSGSAGYIQNQNSTDQAGDYRIAGTARANTSVLTPLLDTASATALNIGTTNATAINLNKNTNVTGNLAVTGNSTTRAASNSATTFQVQNSAGNNVIAIDTTNFNTNTANLITNSGFETNTTGWSLKSTAANLTRETAAPRTGAGYGSVINDAANEGMKFNITLTPSTFYTGSFYARLGTDEANASNVITAGYSSNGSTDNTPCATDNQVVSKGAWTRITCSFTTPASNSGTPYFYIKQSDATARVLLVDDVFLRADDYSTTADTSNGAIHLQGVVNSPMVLQSATNNTNALQVLNSAGNSIFNVDNSDPGNMIQNSSFETSTLGWSENTGAAGNFSSDQALFGSRSYKIVTAATANAGVAYDLPSTDLSRRVTPSTEYTVSWYAKLDTGTFTDIKARYTRNGTNYVECTPSAQTVVNYGWTKFVCRFTADATAPTANAKLHIVQTAGTARTFWIDGVRMEQGSVANTYGNGSISLDAVITSQMTLRGKDNSSNAFNVQSKWGDTIFNVDTSNYEISIGAVEGGSATSTTVEIATSTTNAQYAYMGSTFGDSQTAIRAGTGDLYLYTDSANASVIVKNNSNSTQTFTILTSGDVPVFTVDTANSRTYIGNPTADSTGALLVLDSKNTAGDPTGVNGGMYFNSSTQTFRCYSSGAWGECGGGRYVQSNQGTQSGNLPPAGDSITGTTPTTFSDVYSVPANDCVPGRSYRVTAGGLFTTNGGSQPFNLTLMWGSTTIANTEAGNATTPGSGALTNENWHMEAIVTCYTNFSGTMSAEARGMMMMTQSSASMPDSAVIRNNSTGQTITTNSAQNLGLRMTWGGTGDTITLRTFVVEAIGP